MTRYAVVREDVGGPVVCHFGPVRDFASQTEALLAMLSYTPATPDYNVIPVDGDWTDGPLPKQPEVVS